MITKTHWMIGAGVVGVLLFMRGRKQEAAKTAIQEAVPADGTNWTGASMWERMDSSDLQAKTCQNLDGSCHAQPSTVGRAGLGLSPSWNGNL